MAITLMICFARSGGTILNQCLGSLPNVVILSEVNPLGGGSGKEAKSYQTVKDQAKNWYQIDINSDNFVTGISELETICQERQLNLIVRDWTFINFMPWEDNNYNPPQKLLAFEALQEKHNINSFAFVRDAIDVWISRGTPPIADFFNMYLKYVEAILNADISIFKYEDFCNTPDLIIKRICNLSNIIYDDFNQGYLDFNKVNGDIQLQSRGRDQKVIRPLPRKFISPTKINELNQSQAMIQANKLLGYPTSYYSVSRESLILKGIKYIARNTNKIWQKKHQEIIR